MSIRQLLLALVALSFVAFVVRANDDTDAIDVETNDIEDGSEQAEDRDPNAISGVFARAFFDNQDVLSVPRFPAGEKIYTNVGFSNDIKNPTYDVFYIGAFITRLGDHFNHLQNFSGIRHERPVARGETANFRYAFTPDALLEPLEYNLVVRLYFRNDGNQTFAVTAYNSTIVIEDPLGTDPKTIMTFLTIGAIFAAVAYIVNSRRKKAYVPRGRAAVVSGTNSNVYDPEYVSKEHLQYRDAVLRRSSASPNKRK